MHLTLMTKNITLPLHLLMRGICKAGLWVTHGHSSKLCSVPRLNLWVQGHSLVWGHQNVEMDKSILLLLYPYSHMPELESSWSLSASVTDMDESSEEAGEQFSLSECTIISRVCCMLYSLLLSFLLPG